MFSAVPWDEQLQLCIAYAYNVLDAGVAWCAHTGQREPSARCCQLNPNACCKHPVAVPSMQPLCPSSHLTPPRRLPGCRLAPRATYRRLSPLLRLCSLLLMHSLPVWSSIDAFNAVQPSPSQVGQPCGWSGEYPLSLALICLMLAAIVAGRRCRWQCCFRARHLGKHAPDMHTQLPPAHPCPAGPLWTLARRLLASHL